MISVSLALWILAIHWIADFVLQSGAMAKGKSGSFLVLTWHVSVYATALLVGMACVSSTEPEGIMLFVFVNAVAHWFIDASTSRATSALWAAREVHWFFVVIGFDQLLHVAVLLWTAERLLT